MPFVRLINQFATRCSSGEYGLVSKFRSIIIILTLCDSLGHRVVMEADAAADEFLGTAQGLGHASSAIREIITDGLRVDRSIRKCRSIAGLRKSIIASSRRLRVHVVPTAKFAGLGTHNAIRISQNFL